MFFRIDSQDASDLRAILKTSKRAAAARLLDRLDHLLTATSFAQCQQCGREFEVVKDDQRFCTPHCRITAHRSCKRHQRELGNA